MFIETVFVFAPLPLIISNLRNKNIVIKLISILEIDTNREVALSDGNSLHYPNALLLMLL